jgi:lariat debranching enzyme
MRNMEDLESMACPDKYKELGTFHNYYGGTKRPPCPVLFIGGNHEASHYMWELYHGGWACQDIYFLGWAGMVKFGGLRIAGISGIYKEHHYSNGHYERLPLDQSDCRSIYHVRKIQVYKLAQIKSPIDVFLSHDWPRGIAHYGDTARLLSVKKFLRKEVLLLR